jgi:hypothetical protein
MDRVTVKAISLVNEPPCAGLTGDECGTARPPAGHEGPASRATADHGGTASGRLSGDEAAPTTSHTSAALCKSGCGTKRNARHERERDRPEGHSPDHRDASAARDGRSLHPRRGAVKRAPGHG